MSRSQAACIDFCVYTYIATVRILEPLWGVQKVFYFTCFGITASSQYTHTFNCVHIRVFFNTESLNERAIHFKQQVVVSVLALSINNRNYYPNLVILPVDNNEHQRIDDVSTDRISYDIRSVETMGFAL